MVTNFDGCVGKKIIRQTAIANAAVTVALINRLTDDMGVDDHDSWLEVPLSPTS